MEATGGLAEQHHLWVIGLELFQPTFKATSGLAVESTPNSPVDMHIRGWVCAMEKHYRVAANGVRNLQTQLSPFESLGNNWEGSVYVTSTGPMVGIVDTLWVAGSARMSTYDAIGN